MSLAYLIIQDILDEFSDISDSCLSNISVMIRSPVITELNDQQLVYEAYSNVRVPPWPKLS